jgi:uncharacterized membrane protein
LSIEVIIVPSSPQVRFRALLTLIPLDIALIMIWLAAALCMESLLPATGILIKTAVALPLVLLIPGYLLIALLFPSARDLRGIERIVLSVVFSVAIVPMLVFILNFTPEGIVLDSVLTALSLLILLLVMLVVIRRLLLPEEARFSLHREVISAGVLSQSVSERAERLCLVLLFTAVLLFLVITALVLAFPGEGEHYTEFYLLGADQTMTNLSYPVSSNDSFPVVIGVRNHEYRPITYTIEVMEVNSTINPVTKTTVIREMAALSVFTLAVQQNQSVHVYDTLDPPDKGYNMLQFLLFPDGVPEPEVWGQDRVNQSYRHLDLKARPT